MGLMYWLSENDTGKTAIVDAIRYVLRTQSAGILPWMKKILSPARQAQANDRTEDRM